MNFWSDDMRCQIIGDFFRSSDRPVFGTLFRSGKPIGRFVDHFGLKTIVYDKPQVAPGETLEKAIERARASTDGPYFGLVKRPMLNKNET